MSLMSVSHTIDRIKGATELSKIAVFRCEKSGEVNAVFASTVKTQKLIREKHPDLIGVYDSSMNLHEIERTLRHYAR
jgi:hypothetical protein